MKIKVYQVNAFVGGENGGNPAGVVLNADELTHEHMQRIALELGYSETAFVLKSNQADYRTRFFTTGTEVPLCGHASLATRYLLQTRGLFTKQEGRQETQAGLLALKLVDDRVVMEQALPTFNPYVNEDVVLGSLSITRSDLLEGMPIEIVSTGFPTIIVPMKSLEKVKSIKVDLDKGRIVSNKTNLIHVFTMESIVPGSIVFSRNFFPDITEDEDAATGTSTGAMACYMYHHRLLEKHNMNNLVFDQGNFMGKPCRLIVNLEIDGTTINKVWVGGKCEVAKEFEVEL